jgi:hypothetical protein
MWSLIPDRRFAPPTFDLRGVGASAGNRLHGDGLTPCRTCYRGLLQIGRSRTMGLPKSVACRKQ